MVYVDSPSSFPRKSRFLCVEYSLFAFAFRVACRWPGREPVKADEGPSSKQLPLVFSEDFEQGSQRWETSDSKSWDLHQDRHPAAKSAGAQPNQVFGLNRPISDYQPKVRSPHNIALIKDLELEDFELTVRVRSTRDSGNHRDCCLFFNYQDPEHFYYVHLGAKPDPHSGQIMIVNGEPRQAITQNVKPVPWDDEWHTARVVRDSKSGSIEVFFDDMQQPLMRAVDKTFGKGRLGIGSFDDMDDFDQIQVRGR